MRTNIDELYKNLEYWNSSMYTLGEMLGLSVDLLHGLHVRIAIFSLPSSCSWLVQNKDCGCGFNMYPQFITVDNNNNVV